MNTFQENIANFIGNNLKKVSQNSRPPVSKFIDFTETKSPTKISTSNISPPKTSPVRESLISESIVRESPVYSSNGRSSNSGSWIQTIGKIIIFIILLLVIWHYTKKYYPKWKMKLKHFFSKFSSNINYRNTKGNEPAHYEKEKQTKFDNDAIDPMFDKKNNLNSNQILDYLLNEKKEKDNNTEKNEWCFYGKSGNKRYCTLAEGNKCMSGEIFPTQDLCINPKLRE